VPFPSGENVKAVSLMRYEYFRLLYNVLMMIQFKGGQEGHAELRTSTEMGEKKKSLPPLKEIKEEGDELKENIPPSKKDKDIQ
jgi:hypothetical protein